MLSNFITYGMFLTNQELNELTDRKIPKAQINWLRKQSYPFEISANGKPKVLREYVMQKLRDSKSVSSSTEPNFDAIR